MKKHFILYTISLAVFFFLLLFALAACESKSGKLSHSDNFINPPTEELKVETSDRIKVIDRESGLTGTLKIVEVDGHLYLCNYQGGVVHMESCPCKSK